MILACHSIQKTFVAAPVLRGGYFHLEEKEKAAIVGINGAGKSTLLKIITGELAPDDGELILAKGRSIGYLAQHQSLSSERTIYEEVASAKEELLQMEETLRRMEQEMTALQGEALEQMMERYGRLHHSFEEQNGYACRSEIVGVLKGLGFEEADFSKYCHTLSGGQKTRVSLGKLLLTSPDIILLDEPTNHLDIASIAWLEGYLRDYPGAVLVVSHDRYFQDRVVSKVIEIEHGIVTMYTGNYTAYAQKKQQLREAALKQYFNQQKEIRRQEEVITKLRSFNREKSIKRAESREKALNKIERLDKPQELNDSMFFTLEPHEVSGNDVLTIRSLAKSFGSQLLFEKVDLDIRRGEKVAIIGDNGTGKTTLLRMINDLTPADEGMIRLGARVAIGYYDQEQHLLTESNTLFDEVRESYPNMTDTQIRSTLAAFLFTGDDVFKLVSELSGGERGRLSLAKLILSPCNFLILDEPTNHLDMVSREILERALQSYTGTVLYVSHDRYFVNRTATRILELADKAFTGYIGNYDYYLEKKAEQTARESADAARSVPAAAALTESALERRARKEEQTKLRRVQNRIRKLEEDIDEAEQKLKQRDERMADSAIATNAAELMRLSSERQALEAALEDMMLEWEELQS